MNELSIFVDESGDKTQHSRYFLLTLVMHDQSYGISEVINHYERSLLLADLPNIPFHAEPLLNGRKDYLGLSVEQRKKMLVTLNVLIQRLPIKYKTFVYRQKEMEDAERLTQRLERDITNLLIENLGFYQAFDYVKIYYDNGQPMVKRALDSAISSVLSKQAIVKKRTTMTEYRLAQVADYLCAIELAAVKYEAKEDGGTYNKFFGGVGAFKKNWLKQARRKRID